MTNIFLDREGNVLISNEKKIVYQGKEQSSKRKTTRQISLRNLKLIKQNRLANHSTIFMGNGTPFIDSHNKL